MTIGYQFDLLRTYRFVRLAMVLLVLLLFVAVALHIASSGQMLQSISASYYTPVRAVFVSSLCAIGTALIVYQGNTDVEDVLLNGSGFFAFIVAFVPTRPEATCVASAIPQDVQDAISNNVTALLVIAAVAFVAVMGIQVYATPESERELSKGTGAAIGVSMLAFLGLTGFYLFNRGGFMCHGHDAAAGLLFLGIVAVRLRQRSGARDHPGQGVTTTGPVTTSGTAMRSGSSPWSPRSWSSCSADRSSA